jgi:hypothetical protein
MMMGHHVAFFIEVDQLAYVLVSDYQVLRGYKIDLR